MSSSAAEIDAALAWADRMESGLQANYDPYIVALARVVRQQQKQIARLEGVITSGADRPPDWEKVLDELHAAREQLAAVADAISPLNPLALRSEITLFMDKVEYRVVEESAARQWVAAVAKLRGL